MKKELPKIRVSKIHNQGLFYKPARYGDELCCCHSGKVMRQHFYGHSPVHINHCGAAAGAAAAEPGIDNIIVYGAESTGKADTCTVLVLGFLYPDADLT